MATFTTEQMLPFTFRVVDGRGRTVAIEENATSPIAASSDETIATVTLTKGDNNVWNGVLTSVTASPEGSTQRVTVTADVDLSPVVQDVVGFLDFNVTLDPRTAARIVELTAGDATDKVA